VRGARVCPGGWRPRRQRRRPWSRRRTCWLRVEAEGSCEGGEGGEGLHGGCWGTLQDTTVFFGSKQELILYGTGWAGEASLASEGLHMYIFDEGLCSHHQLSTSAITMSCMLYNVMRDSLLLGYNR
jgi:hypothetical protein